MNVFSWIVLIAVGFSSMIPVIVLNQFKEVSKYRALRHLMGIIFFWTIIIFLFYTIDFMIINYYLMLMLYPTVFLVVYFGFETVQSFTGSMTSKWLKIVFFSYFMIILTVSLTNPLHHIMIDIETASITQLDDLIYSDIGWFFYVHTGFSYSVIISFLLKLLSYLRRPAQKEVDSISYYLLIVTVAVGLTLNFTHLFVYNFYLDPTYIAIVLFGFAIYFTVFKRDFHLNLLNSGRKQVIDSMREMMIIADHQGTIIDYSEKIERFFVDREIPKNLIEFMKVIETQAFLYDDFDQVKDHSYETDKPYFYTRNKPLVMPTYKKQGQLILMYDETRIVHLVHKLNYLRNYDQMTELYNRNYFEEHRSEFEEQCEHAGVIMLDLNGLKLLNDHFGHEKGDEWIVRLAKVLKSHTDDINSIAIRLGGDEFLLFYRSIIDVDLDAIAKEIDAQVSDDNIEKHLSISYGTARRKGQEMLDKVLSRADKNLYQMKQERSPAYRKELLGNLAKKKA